MSQRSSRYRTREKIILRPVAGTILQKDCKQNNDFGSLVPSGSYQLTSVWWWNSWNVTWNYLLEHFNRAQIYKKCDTFGKGYVYGYTLNMIYMYLFDILILIPLNSWAGTSYWKVLWRYHHLRRWRFNKSFEESMYVYIKVQTLFTNSTCNIHS